MSQAAATGSGQPTPTRRARVRAATVAEIKQLAWRQIGEVGAAALSLRAVANEMGMTSSALYRYFASRDELLRELMVDGFSSLADSLESAERELDDDTGIERWLQLASAHRRWALEHPAQYSLIFGTPVPGLDSESEECHAQMKRGVNVLFRCMMTGLARGELDGKAMEDSLTPSLRKRLHEWRDELAYDLSTSALAGCLFAWAQLHGAVSLELFGHLPPQLQPGDELFEHQMRQVLRVLGLQSRDLRDGSHR
jgi:AcrR family transcriptional regulator